MIELVVLLVAPSALVVTRHVIQQRRRDRAAWARIQAVIEAGR